MNTKSYEVCEYHLVGKNWKHLIDLIFRCMPASRIYIEKYNGRYPNTTIKIIRDNIKTTRYYRITFREWNETKVIGNNKTLRHLFEFKLLRYFKTHYSYTLIIERI